METGMGQQKREENENLFHQTVAVQANASGTPDEWADTPQTTVPVDATLRSSGQAQESEQSDTMVHTIGQMRELIMDFPASLMAANFFKAFSDGTRLRLLQALSVREMCVSDLCELLELSQPAVSNHLRVLNHQRIVKHRRSGKNIFYSLDDWHINAIIGMAMEHLSFAQPER